MPHERASQTISHKLEIDFLDIKPLYHAGSHFPKEPRKIIFGGVTILVGIGRQMTKINITFSVENGLPNTMI